MQRWRRRRADVAPDVPAAPKRRPPCPPPDVANPDVLRARNGGRGPAGAGDPDVGAGTPNPDVGTPPNGLWAASDSDPDVEGSDPDVEGADPDVQPRRRPPDASRCSVPGAPDPDVAASPGGPWGLRVDSDTDVEEEGEAADPDVGAPEGPPGGARVGGWTLVVESDTDVEEEEGAHPDVGRPRVPQAASGGPDVEAKAANPDVEGPAGSLEVGSDTDVEEDGADPDVLAALRTPRNIWTAPTVVMETPSPDVGGAGATDGEENGGAPDVGAARGGGPDVARRRPPLPPPDVSPPTSDTDVEEVAPTPDVRRRLRPRPRPRPDVGGPLPAVAPPELQSEPSDPAVAPSDPAVAPSDPAVAPPDPDVEPQGGSPRALGWDPEEPTQLFMSNQEEEEEEKKEEEKEEEEQDHPELLQEPTEPKSPRGHLDPQERSSTTTGWDPEAPTQLFISKEEEEEKKEEERDHPELLQEPTEPKIPCGHLDPQRGAPTTMGWDPEAPTQLFISKEEEEEKEDEDQDHPELLQEPTEPKSPRGHLDPQRGAPTTMEWDPEAPTQLFISKEEEEEEKKEEEEDQDHPELLQEPMETKSPRGHLDPQRGAPTTTGWDPEAPTQLFISKEEEEEEKKEEEEDQDHPELLQEPMETKSPRGHLDPQRGAPTTMGWDPEAPTQLFISKEEEEEKEDEDQDHPELLQEPTEPKSPRGHLDPQRGAPTTMEWDPEAPTQLFISKEEEKEEEEKEDEDQEQPELLQEPTETKSPRGHLDPQQGAPTSMEWDPEAPTQLFISKEQEEEKKEEDQEHPELLQEPTETKSPRGHLDPQQGSPTTMKWDPEAPTQLFISKEEEKEEEEKEEDERDHPELLQEPTETKSPRGHLDPQQGAPTSMEWDPEAPTQLFISKEEEEEEKEEDQDHPELLQEPTETMIPRGHLDPQERSSTTTEWDPEAPTQLFISKEEEEEEEEKEKEKEEDQDHPELLQEPTEPKIPHGHLDPQRGAPTTVEWDPEAPTQLFISKEEEEEEKKEEDEDEEQPGPSRSPTETRVPLEGTMTSVQDGAGTGAAPAGAGLRRSHRLAGPRGGVASASPAPTRRSPRLAGGRGQTEPRPLPADPPIRRGRSQGEPRPLPAEPPATRGRGQDKPRPPALEPKEPSGRRGRGQAEPRPQAQEPPIRRGRGQAEPRPLPVDQPAARGRGQSKPRPPALEPKEPSGRRGRSQQEPRPLPMEPPTQRGRSQEEPRPLPMEPPTQRGRGQEEPRPLPMEPSTQRGRGQEEPRPLPMEPSTQRGRGQEKPRPLPMEPLTQRGRSQREPRPLPMEPPTQRGRSQEEPRPLPTEPSARRGRGQEEPRPLSPGGVADPEGAGPPQRPCLRPRWGAGSAPPKVLFTGVVASPAMETSLKSLGGSVATSVFDCSHLVTDRVRRTVKFLCAVARGVPIVTPEWLLKGYEVHVTPNVRPDPEQMRDIITCSGGTFLATMPDTYGPRRLVLSCPQDAGRWAPALAARLPIASAELLLTGLLQHRLHLPPFLLAPPPAGPQ
ncbi:mediator of DNA damage checkpoint protein 1 isoform X2 [Phaenicophaeus curvirostris]|uniref:mediator of DNA damage checkpoint protein 1 isoform X2 n=1 Tax=Phaenicophaeus curvirostris TaxID=33595 RepID=UPI0037F0DD48